MRTVIGIGVLVVLLAVGCSGDSDGATETSIPLATQAPATSTTQLVGAEGVEPWEPFAEATVSFVQGGDPLPVLLADTPEQRSQGLMGVTDFQGYAGMLFVFENPVASGFWMKNTPTPLTVMYFTEDGNEVSRAVMDPCGDSNSCPGYDPSGAYLYALEMPTGSDLLPDAPARIDITLGLAG